MEEEIWKDINGFENYKISNFGKINNGKKNLTPSMTKDGYLRIGLYKSSRQYFFLVHRLVAEHFLPNASKEILDSATQTKNKIVIINHKDGIKTNNNIDNLEWSTYKQNTNHAVSYGFQKGRKGETNSESKLNDEQVLEIRKSYKEYNFSQRYLAKKYGVSHGTIWKILNNITWTHIQ